MTSRFYSSSTTVGYSAAHVLPYPTPQILRSFRRRRIFSGEGGRVVSGFRLDLLQMFRVRVILFISGSVRDGCVT
jgi:hypothetical protein